MIIQDQKKLKITAGKWFMREWWTRHCTLFQIFNIFFLSWLLGLMCFDTEFDMAVLWLGQSVTGLSVWRALLDSRPVHVKLVVDRVKLEQISLRLIWFSNWYHSVDVQYVCISFIYHQHFIIPASDSTVIPPYLNQVPSVTCSRLEFKNSLHNKGHDWSSSISIVKHFKHLTT